MPSSRGSRKAAAAALFGGALTLALPLALPLAGGCSGREFIDGTCGEKPCERPSSGGTAGLGGSDVAGGAASGSAVGGGGGAAGTGGGAGSGEDGGAGAEGGSGSGAADFPSTALLDDFNRSDGAPGLTWLGAGESYAVAAQQLSCSACVGAALWSLPFGENQEVFGKLAAFDGAANEINLLLKAQGSSTCEYIEVIYSPRDLHVRVDYCVEGKWTELEPTALLLQPGDQLGARAHADGTVQVFANGALVTERDVSAFPHAFGRIGVNGVAGQSPLRWDDFGGGNWK